MIKLTPEQIIYKELFEMIREKQEAYRKTMLYHMVAHEKEGHVVVPMDESELEYPDPSTGAICAVCQKYLGGYCPNSPTHLCNNFDRLNSKFCEYCKVSKEKK